jgi:hypothetical protein
MLALTSRSTHMPASRQIFLSIFESLVETSRGTSAHLGAIRMKVVSCKREVGSKKQNDVFERVFNTIDRKRCQGFRTFPNSFP